MKLLKVLIRKHLVLFSLIAGTIVLLILALFFKRQMVETLSIKNGILSSVAAAYWGALLGGLVSGALTLVGVLMSNFRQDEVFKENQRLANMPILHFSVDEVPGEVVYSISENNFRRDAEYVKLDEKKPIVITILSNNPAFDLKLVDSKTVPNQFEEDLDQSEDWFVDNQRISKDKPGKLSIDFCFDNPGFFTINGAWRFEYLDVFGNKYYQDVIYEYSETNYDHMKYVGKQLAFFQFLMNRNNPIGRLNILKNYSKESISNAIDALKYRISNLDISEEKAMRTFHIVSLPTPELAGTSIISLADRLAKYDYNNVEENEEASDIDMEKEAKG